MEYLQECFLQKEEEFWRVGAGMSYLDYYTNEKSKNRIEILFDKEYGFYLRYKAWHQDFHTLGNGNFEKIVSVYVGGNPIRIPSAFFISKEQARQIVQLFVTNGTKSEAVTWLDDTDFDWDYGVV